MDKNKNPKVLKLTMGKDRAIIDPHDEYVYEMKTGVSPRHDYPKNCIICFQPEVIELARKKTGFKKIETLIDSDVFEFTDNDREIGIIRFGVGAPYSSLLIERLIARGFENFFVVGTAGSLLGSAKPGHTLLVNKAICGDGVSRHYKEGTDEESGYSYPDEKLTECLKKSLTDMGISFSEGTTWTTDAGYRETVEKVKGAIELGAVSVDMEASAILSICEFRKKRAAYVFSLSDSFTEDWEWNPHFHLDEIRIGLKTGVSAILETIKSLD